MRNAMMDKNYKYVKIIVICCLIGFIVMLFLYWQNNGITTTTYNYENSKLPVSFNGFTIVQVSDLHNKNFKGTLTQKIIEAHPDIIVITGDLIDSRRTSIPDAMVLIESLKDVAPIYYVSGNHEQRSPAFDALKQALSKQGVQLMDGKYTRLEKSGESIGLLGIADPQSRLSEYYDAYKNDSEYVLKTVESIFQVNTIRTDFNILLSHRPELAKAYTQSQMDLVFTGHAHGGQVRLPFLGGIVAPNQGFFPKWTEGIHPFNGSGNHITSMIVSRGLGNSIVPIRIFNHPELVVVKLHRGGL